MNVSINAKTIKQVVTADTAYVSNQEALPASADLVQAIPPPLPAGSLTAIPLAAEPSWQALAATLPEFADDLRSLGQLLPVDESSSLNKMRYITEKVLHTLCARHGVAWGQAEPTLERMIGPLLAEGVIPKNIGLYVRTVQTNASPGSHYQESALTPAHVRIAASALAELLAWFTGTTCKVLTPPQTLRT